MIQNFKNYIHKIKHQIHRDIKPGMIINNIENIIYFETF